MSEEYEAEPNRINKLKKSTTPQERFELQIMASMREWSQEVIAQGKPCPCCGRP